MSLGGNMIKIVETNLLIDSVEFIQNDIYQKTGGVHAMYSDLVIQNSEFDVRNQSD
jgi:hypothetical protein